MPHVWSGLAAGLEYYPIERSQLLMKYPEEFHAKDLHAALSGRFKDEASTTELTVSGDGVHWSVEARRGSFNCCIACFDQGEAEYYTKFGRDSDELAVARTSTKEGTINAVAL